MSQNNFFIKDPNAVLDYSNDWSDWLVTGDAITASNWFIVDSSLATDITATSSLIIDRQSFSGNIATVWLSAGNLNEKFYVVNRVSTTEGRTDDRHIEIVSQNK